MASMTTAMRLPQLPVSERSAEEKLATLSPEAMRRWLEQQTPETLADIARGAWWWRRRAKQTPPQGNWLVWVIGSGRGWGKNQTGAETLIEWILAYPKDRNGHRTEWLVVAESLSDVVKFNVEGPSGLVNTLIRHGYRQVNRAPKPGSKIKCFTYTQPKGKPSIVLYPDKQIIHCDSADDEDVGRGANLAGMWLDEIAKWGPMAHDAWYQGLLPALRTDLPDGGIPRCIVTTTPKPIGLLKQWYARAAAGDPAYRVTIGATYENAANLAPNTLEELFKELDGTRLGRQELYGELLDEVEGALWTRTGIDATRVKADQVPPLVRVAVGVDPAGTGAADEMGLVVIGADKDGEQYVLSDLSKKLAGLAAARHAWKALIAHQHWVYDQQQTPRLVVEEDYAKQWLKDVLTVVYTTMKEAGLFNRLDRPPIEYVSASLLGGKGLRAEPVAMRYEVARVHHVGVHPGLEDQMCTWDPMDKKAKSPDRVDALVHASLWLRDRERRHTQTGSSLDNMSMPVTQLTVG